MRIGVLRNPLSTKNVGKPCWEVPDGVSLVESSADKPIADAVRELVQEGLDLLVIDGGDGTITAALSALIADEVAIPPIGFIANGNTNLIARKTGGSLKPEGFSKLAETSSQTLRDKLRRTPVLRFTIEGQEVRCGFIAGWGAYARGTRIAIEEMETRHDKQIAAAIFATFRRSLVGNEARDLRDGIDCRFEVDGVETILEAKRFVGVVTCFKGRLAAGVQPFWGKGRKVIRWLDVISPPRYHLLLAPFVLFGLRLPIFECLGYRSGRASRLSVTLSEEMIIDGEIVSLQPATRLDIDADLHLDILHL